jgi:hypothetical protein
LKTKLSTLSLILLLLITIPIYAQEPQPNDFYCPGGLYWTPGEGHNAYKIIGCNVDLDLDGRVAFPDWSPNGDRLAFAHDLENGEYWGVAIFDSQSGQVYEMPNSRSTNYCWDRETLVFETVNHSYRDEYGESYDSLPCMTNHMVDLGICVDHVAQFYGNMLVSHYVDGVLVRTSQFGSCLARNADESIIAFFRSNGLLAYDNKNHGENQSIVELEVLGWDIRNH